MNSEDKYMSFEKMEAEIFDELYKRTPLKKRLVQMHSLLSDEEKISLKPVMQKPVKRFMESYVKSTSLLEPEQNAACVRHVKTSVARAIPKAKGRKKMKKPVKRCMGSCAKSTSFLEPERNAACVRHVKTSVARAIPKAKGRKKMKKPVKKVMESYVKSTSLLEPEQNAKTFVAADSSSSVEMNKAADAAQVAEEARKQQLICDDYGYALELVREEFNLRTRCRKEGKPGLKTILKHERSPVKRNGTSAVSETKASNSPPSKKRKIVGGKKGKKRGRKVPKKAAKVAVAVAVAVDVEEESGEDPFSSESSNKMSKLSPVLAGIFGRKKAKG